MAYCRDCRKNKTKVNLRSFTMAENIEKIVDDEIATGNASNVATKVEEATGRKLSVEEIVAIRRKEMTGVVNK